MQGVQKMVLSAAVMVVLLAVAPAIANVTVSGTVMASGGGPLAGVTVRTSGDPSVSTVTASNGSYSLNLPSKIYTTYAFLASAPGRMPERLCFTMNDGQSQTVNFALRPADGGQVVNLPAPLDWGEPPSAPAASGDNYPIAFADMTAQPAAGAPVIAEWSETVKPDESFTMTGSQFTTRTGADAGTDTIVWVWARTSSSGGALKQATVWKVASDHIVATLPADIPFGMYLVWVENANGASAPVCINRTATKYNNDETSWIGPMPNTSTGVMTAYAGQSMRIFGRNLSYNHGTTTDNVSVYIQPAAGGSFTQCAVTNVNPYNIEFTVPAGTPNGNYRAYMHNGHGGAYGWGDPLAFTVATRFVRGSAQVAVAPKNNGTDDAPAINSAINSMAGQPNGGAVVLSAGTYSIQSPIAVKSKVALQGAGIDATTLLWQRTSAYGGTAIDMGSQTNSAITDFTFTTATGTDARLSCDFSAYEAWGGLMKNVRINSLQFDGRDRGMWPADSARGCEITGCEFYREISFWGSNWIHNNKFYGDYYWATEAGCGFYSQNDCFEYNHSETKNWPVGPDGSRNYMEFMFNQLTGTVWCKRVALCYTRSTYIANNTSKDVAVQDNKGEMLLFHTFYAPWWGQALSNSGLTATVRNDGKVFDQTVTLDNYGQNTQGGGAVTQAFNWWGGGALYNMIIIGGKGMGQSRGVQYNGTTSNTISVLAPWRVAPDSTSVAIFTGMWSNNIVYNNDLNAFPAGYVQMLELTASTGVQFDGNAWKNSVEANTSHRTEAGRRLFGWSCGPNSWNEERDETAIDCHTRGITVSTDYNPYGPVTLGNAFRNFSGNSWDIVPYGYASGGTILQGLGMICENMTFAGSAGYNLGGSYPSGTSGGNTAWQDGLVLYRNGNITVNNSPNTPVNMTANDGRQFLVNNTYSGNTPYWGGATYSQPVPMLRLAKFVGYAGYPVGGQLVPIANVGTAGVAWTATPSDSWITAAIQSNGSLDPEATMGRLAVGVNTSGLAVGTHWGSVTVSGAGQSVKVGVRVDILAGTPANTPPTAAFTATPSAGTAPRVVAFNAGASYDTDGIIASYYWDFGDGSYGSGAATSHTYTCQGTFTPVLAVTDNSGLTGQAWTNVSVSPSLTSITLSDSPSGPVDAGTPVTLTAVANGGYQTSYRFLISTGNGWSVLRDYSTSGTIVWTPASAGYYEIKAQAKAADSTNVFDATSNLMTYPVGQVPTSGIKLWLKADSGVTADASGNVSSWADQSGSGNSVSQTNSNYQPLFVAGAQGGRPAVRFSGGAEYLQASGLVLTGTTAYTAFEVMKVGSLPPSTNQYIWWNGDATVTSGYGSGISTQSKIWCGWAGQNKALYDGSAAVVGNWYRITSRFGSNTHEMWVNGTSRGTIVKTGSNFANGAFTVGNYSPSPTQGLYGDLAELLIYNRSLTEAERTSVESYLAARWATKSVASVDRLKDVKALADGVLVSISSAKVAIVASGIYSDGGIYVSESDRTCGMKVTGAGIVNLGDNLTLSGTVDTDQATGEKVLRVSNVSLGANTPLVTLGMTNKGIIPSGQLVRVWGKVTSVAQGYFVVDDGSGSAVKVEIDGLSAAITSVPAVGQYVSATGPVGLMAGGVPAVRVRSDSDIRVY